MTLTTPSSHAAKADLRARGMAARAALPDGVRRAGAKALASKAPSLTGVRRVSLYHAIGDEIDPAPLAGLLAASGHALALPVLVDRTTLVFRQWRPGEALVPAGFGTQGPVAGAPETVPDLVFAPLAAFSADGQRIGYGKGHYDRALAKMRAAGSDPRLIGLAFDEQEVEPFPSEPHDVPLDAVLTPSGLQLFDHGAARLRPLIDANGVV